MNSVWGVLLVGWISVVGGVPVTEGTGKSVDTGFISKGTNELATALLQGYVQKEENMVYSPFGYSAILAVFSEGARGASREEIAEALHYPSDVERVREAYRSVLERFVVKKFSNAPEFKNWFYIYKNYSVEEELQNVLRKYYLTEVKCVDRPEDYIKETKRAPIKESMDPDQKIAIEMSQVAAEPPVQVQQEESKNENLMEKAIVPEEPKAISEPQKVEEKPMEMSAMIQENTKINMKNSPEVAEKTMETVKTEISPDEPPSKVQKLMSEEEEKPTSPVMASSESEPMQVDHFSGMTDSSLKIRGPDPTPRMVIFNGLYYKGEWETPFVKKPADDSRVFYKSDKEKIFVSTIHSQGVFNFGEISSLDSKAIELPYKGGRYSLLILVPNTRNGLTKLISDLSGYSFSRIYDELSEKLVNVCLPSFEINTISKPISPITKLGVNKVTSIFSPEKADLSGISSKDTGLYVEELVQMVTFKVDAEFSKANFLTASIASSRSNVQNFQINQPFLFYLRDNLEDIVIVNGKVIDPTPKPNFYFT